MSKYNLYLLCLVDLALIVCRGRSGEFLSKFIYSPLGSKTIYLLFICNITGDTNITLILRVEQMSTKCGVRRWELDCQGRAVSGTGSVGEGGGGGGEGEI